MALELSLIYLLWLYLEWETPTYVQRAFSIGLPVLSVSAYFNMVIVSKSLTGEEGIKALDSIAQHRLSCLSAVA